MRQLRNIAVLPQYGAGPHLEALIEDMLHATWFRVDLSDWITLTGKGTRPGDPAADVLFSLVFAALVRTLEPLLEAKGLAPSLSQIGDPPQWATRPKDSSLGFPSWADDFVSPVEATSAGQLIANVREVGTLVMERATSLGMRLTFADDKTAALLPSGHDWSLSGAVTHEGRIGIWLSDALSQETQFLSFVGAYKHLGHILTSSTCPQPDILFRRKRAQSVIKPLRARLFGNRNLPLATRRMLLQSLAASRFVHSSAAVILPAAIHERCWGRAFLDIWRVLLPRSAADMQAHSFEVLRAAQAPTPPLAMALARARFLARLTRHGPACCDMCSINIGFVHKRSSWLAQVSSDIDLVLQYLPELLPLFTGDEPVRLLLDSLQQQPEWWLRQVREGGDCTAIRPGCLVAGSGSRERPRWERGSVRPASSDRGWHAIRMSSVFCALSLTQAPRGTSCQDTPCLEPQPAFHFGCVLPCMPRWYGSVSQVGQHLKHSDACLWRLCHLFPPLSDDEIRQVERTEKTQKRLLRAGEWTAYEGSASALFTTARSPPLRRRDSVPSTTTVRTSP